MAYFNDFAQVDMDNWEHLPLHPMCSMFPTMDDSDYENLVGSMHSNGFLSTDPIVLIMLDEEWHILDGQNRHNAAIDALVKPSFVEYLGSDPLGFVMARNMDRRHLNTGQKAAIAAKLAETMLQKDAAKRIGVGEASLRRYKFVEERDPELAAKVASGEVKLEAARAKIKEDNDAEWEAVLSDGTEQREVKDAPVSPDSYSLGDKRKEKRSKLHVTEVDFQATWRIECKDELAYANKLASFIKGLERMGMIDININDERTVQ